MSCGYLLPALPATFFMYNRSGLSTTLIPPLIKVLEARKESKHWVLFPLSPNYLKTVNLKSEKEHLSSRASLYYLEVRVKIGNKVQLVKVRLPWSSRRNSAEANLTRIHDDASSIP